MPKDHPGRDLGSDARPAIPDVLKIVRALAHPIRRRIVQALLDGPTSSIAIAEGMGEDVGNVAYHLIKVLDRQYSLVEFSHAVPRRGTFEKVYRLKPSAWLAVNDDQQGDDVYHLSATAFIALAVLAAVDGEDQTGEESGWVPMAVGVDDQALTEIHAAKQVFAEQTIAAVKGSNKRNGGELDRRHSLILGIATIPYASGLGGLRADDPPVPVSRAPRKKAA